ncbi:MAG: hypothetical protein ACXABY_31035 [Candidatus Thorarchaeota archaeon]|jgi:hypothetical protein
MEVGGKEFSVGMIDADKTIRLTKFIAKVFDEIDEDKQMAAVDNIVRGGFKAFLNVLSPLHLYELTAILMGADKQLISEHWTLDLFTQVIAELFENNDVASLIKNLSRVADALPS